MDVLRASTRLAVATLVVLGVVAGSTAPGWAAENSDPPPDEDPHVRATVAALAVARHVSSLADTASMRTRADMSAAAMAESGASIQADAAEARRQLDVLAGAGHEDAAARMRDVLDALTRTARQIEDGRPEFAQVLRDSQGNREQLIAATSWRLLPAAMASKDDLFFGLLSDRDDAGGQASPTTGAISVEDLLLYARLALLTQQIDQGYIALEVATRQTDSEFIGTVEENANLVMYQLRENIETLSGTDHEALDPMLVPLAGDLVDAAYGETNLIDLMKTRLRLDEREARLADAIDTVSSSLLAEVAAAVDRAVGELERMEANRDTAIALRAALAVSRHASAAASHSSMPTTADTPIAALPESRDTVAAHITGMRQGLDTLGEAGHGPAVEHIHSEVDRLESATERVHAARPDLARALQSAARERAQLRSFVDHQLEPAVVASLDNQLYYMLTGRSEFRDGGPADLDPLSHVEFMRYWHLASVYESLFRTFSGLIIAIIMTESDLIGEGEERFVTASHRLEKSLDFLEEEGGPELDAQLIPLARQFIAFGNGESNVFDSLRHRLPLIASERELLEASRRICSGLQDDMDALLDGILREVASSTE